ncbi:uncharacterized protein LOC142578068 [Dermacentor variabilis]|uniref:uncharacterized protein LOC142578068 n=1 Tax=Dermacentor variabilis TaxID=34621 RepID=UPI003F5C4EFC
MPHFEFLVLLGLFIGAQAKEVSLDDLREALGTNERTWLTQRTYEYQNHSCVYTVKVSLAEMNYTFKQYFKDGDKEEHHTLYARLEDGSAGPSMIVSRKPDEKSGLPYHLKFWNNQENCGILQVRLSGGDQYEMHVWNDKVDRERPECQKQYETLSSGKQSYDVYAQTCKSTGQEN